MTAGQHIDYEALAQDAMRGVVRGVLSRVAKSGLPGDHHFYIAFNTQAPGTIVSKRLREKYPEEMTIVLQHRFWGLVVSEDRFEVNLTFDSIPERLVIPYRAVKVFFDPSVPYGLQFEESELTSESARRALATEPQADALSDLPTGIVRTDARQPARPAPERPDRRRERPPRRSTADKAAEAKSDTRQDNDAAPAAAGPKVPAPSKPSPALTQVKPAEPVSKSEPVESAKVVSLDQFRKK
jgi:hypothetical protein